MNHFSQTQQAMLLEKHGFFMTTVVHRVRAIVSASGQPMAFTWLLLGAGFGTAATAAAATITNLQGQTLGQIILQPGDTVNNQGTITTGISNQGALYSTDAGSFTINNSAGGTIVGTGLGIYLLNGGGTITNDGNGSIISGISYGVAAKTNTTVRNINGAQIGGAINNGHVTGATSVGVNLSGGGTVINDGNGSLISSTNIGVNMFGSGDSLVMNTNGASIIGTNTAGVYLHGGGTVINGVGSTIFSNGTGVGVAGPSTATINLTNAGMITGAVSLARNAVNNVTLVTGGVIKGILNIGTNTASTLTLDGAGNALYSQAVSGTTTFNGALFKNGSGTWTVDGVLGAGGAINVASVTINAGTLVLSGANTYTGDTTVSAGTLRTDTVDSIAASHALTVDGGVFDLNGNNQQVNRLNGAGGEVKLNGAMLTVNNATTADNTTFAGDITDGTTPGGSLTKKGDGSLTLSGNTAWTGDTHIEAGELVLDGSNNGAQLVSNIIGLDGTTLTLRNGASLTGWIDPTNVNIDTASRWNMTADSLVDDVNLAGTINFVAPATLPMNAGHTLTVNNWHGQNGTVVLNTVLGDDNSITDKIVVNGDTSGNTFMKVNNAGGRGAQTIEGIRVVEVNGQSDGTFTKSGRIVAGAYDYSLVKKGTDWFLTSLYVEPPVEPVTPKTPDAPGTPTVRPESASYTANLMAANTMFITRLHDRLGEPQYTDALTGEKKVTSMWLRQVGGHNRFKDSSGQISTQSNRYVVQLGGDIAQWSTDGLQRWHLGVMAGYGNNSSNSHSSVTGYQSKGSVNGYSAGLYATWYENDETKQGMYLDSWAQYGWFNNNVKGQDIQGESYKSSGVTASLEAGYTHKLGEFTGSQGSLQEWYIQPQAQAIWMGVTADDHRESNGTRVSAQGEGNLQTRLGMRTYLKGHGKIDDDKDRTFQPFVEVNWIHNTQDFGTRMDGVSVYQSGARNIGEIKTGVEGQLNKRLNLWGNVGVQIGDKGYSDASAMIGAKYSF